LIQQTEINKWKQSLMNSALISVLFSHTLEKPFNEQALLFITGGAGCGKTFLIKAMMKACRLYGRKYEVLATTGVASMLTRGTTIHAFFKMNLKRESNLDKSSTHAQRIRDVEVLFIDEVSMMEKKLFQAVDGMLRRVRNPGRDDDYKKPFGGRHIVLVGDVAQLPVIQGKGIWNEPLFYEHFKIVNLTINKRQRNEEFLNVLNKIRFGIIDQAVENYLQQHAIDDDIETNRSLFNMKTTFILTPHR
ncbi:hypothetical protein B4U80_12401, partial [Leptotrombidium deliense]